MRFHRACSPFAFRLLFAAFAVLTLSTEPSWAEPFSVGLSTVRGQLFENDDLFVFDPSQGDHFAWAMAAGDFNGDGVDDLATGIPHHEGFAGSDCFDCGIVVVRYGAPFAGLETFSTSTVLYQGFVGSPTPAQPGEQFGYALASGDFNGDGFDDLAVGVPEEDQPIWIHGRGAVEVHYGSPTGLLVQADEWIDFYLTWEFAPDCNPAPERFGWALAVGNFDADAYDDLAIGAPLSCSRDEDGPLDSGAVYVAHGGSDGLLPLAGYFLSEDSIDIFGDAADGEQFGAALAAGDFDGDGDDDLAIGVPQEGDNGSAYIVLGSPFGLIYMTSVYWAPGALGIAPEAGARLGYSLAAGDFDGDGYDDLALGDPQQNVGSSDEIVDAGLVAIAFGAPAGFDLSRTRLLHDPLGSDAGDRFGWALAAGDFDRDGKDDLAVGAPLEDFGNNNRGSASIFSGSANFGSGGSGERLRVLLAGVEGIPSDGQSQQDFGRAFASGDFDGDGHADLAIGSPYYDVSPIGTDVGRQIVLYGSLFADGFESLGFGYWSSAAP